jgi:hypothetical protein
MTGHKGVWDRFCEAHAIARLGVPLFSTGENANVEVFAYGNDGRPMLRRSPAMQAKVCETVAVVLSPESRSEGILYMMHRLDEAGQVIPLYVGKAGRYGRSGAPISANLENIDNNHGRFARWGYNYAYHLGDLSAAVLVGHAPSKIVPKYKRWASALFERAPTPLPHLKFDVRFWCTAWSFQSIGIWPEFSPCSLAFTEYLVIGVASYLFPGYLLNQEGVNRAASPMTPSDEIAGQAV